MLTGAREIASAAAWMPQANYIELRGGHFLPLEQPEAIQRELSTEDGVIFHVDVTDVLREARSQAGAFRGLVTELRQSSSTSRASSE